MYCYKCYKCSYRQAVNMSNAPTDRQWICQMLLQTDRQPSFQMLLQTDRQPSFQMLLQTDSRYVNCVVVSPGITWWREVRTTQPRSGTSDSASVSTPYPPTITSSAKSSFNVGRFSFISLYTMLSMMLNVKKKIKKIKMMFIFIEVRNIDVVIFMQI